MEEIWKDIKGYEGFYQISNFGRVKSLTRVIENSSTYSGKFTIKGKILKLSKDRYGYFIIRLNKDGKGSTKKVHRLVAEHFIPNPDNKPQIDHIDTVRTNNNVNNLRWATAIENSNNPNTKEKYKKRKPSNNKKVLCITTGKEFSSTKEAEKYYNLVDSSVRHAANPNHPQKRAGKLPDGTPLEWKYI